MSFPLTAGVVPLSSISFTAAYSEVFTSPILSRALLDVVTLVGSYLFQALKCILPHSRPAVFLLRSLLSLNGAIKDLHVIGHVLGFKESSSIL